MFRKRLAVGAAAIALVAIGTTQAHAVGVAPLRTAEAHQIIGPFFFGTIDVQGVAQESPGPGLGLSIINAECTATLYSLGEAQYQSINQCTLHDLSNGAVYGLSTVIAQPNNVVARGTFTVPTSHNYAICPQAEFIENTANLVVGPWECGTMS